MCNASGAQLGVSLKAISSTCAVLLVMLSSWAVGLFPCIRRSSPPNLPPSPLSLSCVGGHCCLGSHFCARRIGAACLAFLRLKVSTSTSAYKDPHCTRPRGLGPWRRESAVAWPYFVSRRGGGVESHWNLPSWRESL